MWLCRSAITQSFPIGRRDDLKKDVLLNSSSVVQGVVLAGLNKGGGVWFPSGDEVVNSVW